MSAAGRTEVIARLARELRFASRDALLRMIDAAERLVADLDPDAAYPEEFVVFRITGYRGEPTGRAPVLVPGDVLRADLATFVARLCDRARPTAAELGRTPLALPEAATRLGVHERTLRRYRSLGLVLHRVVESEGGRARLVCFADALEAFAARHADAIARAREFARVPEEAVAAILEDAAGLGAAGRSLNAAARAIATRHDRPLETVRSILQRGVRARRLAFGGRGPLTAREGAFAERAEGFGIAPSRIAARLGRSTDAVQRIVRRRRARRLRGLDLSWIDLPTFAMVDASAVILGAPAMVRDLHAPLPRTRPELLALRRAAAADDADLAALAAGANLLKRDAVRAIAALAPAPGEHALDEIETRLRWAGQAERRLAREALLAMLRRVEPNLGVPAEALPDDALATLLVRCGRDACALAARFDPSRGQHLARQAALAADRAIPATEFGPEGRGSARPTARRPAGFAGAMMLPDLLDEAAPYDRAVRLSPSLATLVDRLDPDDAALVRRRYGLDGGAPATLAALAEAQRRPAHVVLRRLNAARAALAALRRGA